jgi:MFS family permease
MRSNLSVGIEAMSCQYNWSSGVQGTLLSAFFWGYALFQIPGGFLTNKFGGKLIFGVGVLMTSILTCLVTYHFIKMCTKSHFSFFLLLYILFCDGGNFF